MTADAWAELLEHVVAQAVCKDLPCTLVVADHNWYVQIAHVYADADRPHDCPACEPRATPVRVVSTGSMDIRRRARIVAELVRWLAHLHQPPSPRAAQVRGRRSS